MDREKSAKRSRYLSNTDDSIFIEGGVSPIRRRRSGLISNNGFHVCITLSRCGDQIRLMHPIVIINILHDIAPVLIELRSTRVLRNQLDLGA